MKKVKLNFKLANELAAQGLLKTFLESCDDELTLDPTLLENSVMELLRMSHSKGFDPTEKIKHYGSLAEFIKLNEESQREVIQTTQDGYGTFSIMPIMYRNALCAMVQDSYGGISIISKDNFDKIIRSVDPKWDWDWRSGFEIRAIYNNIELLVLPSGATFTTIAFDALLNFKALTSGSVSDKKFTDSLEYDMISNVVTYPENGYPKPVWIK